MRPEEMSAGELRAAIASPLFGEAAKDRLRRLLEQATGAAVVAIRGPAPAPGSAVAATEPRTRRAGRIVWDRLPCPTNQLWVPIVRQGKPAMVKSKRAREWTRWAREQARAQWGGVALSGLVEVRAKVCYDPEAEPDFDAGKQLWDALKGIAYRDDALVRRSIVDKVPTEIGAAPYVEVWIRPWKAAKGRGK